jgi:predicted nucleic acid-binding protein
MAQPRTFYLDASVLVKRYLAETGSAWVESLYADEGNNAIAIARFGLVETAAAFAAKRRGQFITDREYESALADLLRDAGVALSASGSRAGADRQRNSTHAPSKTARL